MPYELPIPASLRKARWKVKIREKETREPPHVTILRGTNAWRIDLRTRQYMDRMPDPDEVPNELLNFVLGEENWRLLCEEWDRKYPTNVVRALEENDED